MLMSDMVLCWLYVHFVFSGLFDWRGHLRNNSRQRGQHDRRPERQVNRIPAQDRHGESVHDVSGCIIRTPGIRMH